MSGLLDDTANMRAMDRLNVLDALLARPTQFSDAISIAQKTSADRFQPEKIIICGMGGSAEPGDLFAAWFRENSAIPISVSRDYTIRQKLNDKSLVIAISHSGNTEEVLSSLESAVKTGCGIACVAAGGKLGEFCARESLPLFRVPDNIEPRAVIGYLYALESLAVEKMGLCEITPELKECVAVLEKMKPSLSPGAATENNPSKQLALGLHDAIPVFYGSGITTPVANCLHSIFNDNGKVLAWWGEFPEMNHNEIVGWERDGFRSKCAPVLLRHASEHPRIRKRIELTKNIAFRGTKGPCEIHARGESVTAQMFSALWAGEFASVYLSFLRGLDLSETDIIATLKKEMNR